MKIRLTADLFDSSYYDLEIKDGKIYLSDGEKKRTVISLEDLDLFSVEGDGKQLKNFILETADKLYEGSFLKSSDAEKFIERLRSDGGCHIDISFESLKGGK